MGIGRPRGDLADRPGSGFAKPAFFAITPTFRSPAGEASMSIPRYSRPQMTAIWEPANKFNIWFRIEAHACDALAALGVIPTDSAKAVWANGDKPYTPERIAR